jgi:hypothetical protein
LQLKMKEQLNMSENISFSMHWACLNSLDCQEREILLQCLEKSTDLLNVY